MRRWPGVWRWRSWWPAMWCHAMLCDGDGLGNFHVDADNNVLKMVVMVTITTVIVAMMMMVKVLVIINLMMIWGSVVWWWRCWWRQQYCLRVWRVWKLCDYSKGENECYGTHFFSIFKIMYVTSVDTDSFSVYNTSNLWKL